jgi:arsenate reductase
MEEFRGSHFSYVVSVCDHAKEACPFFPGDVVLHKSFKDPSSFEGTLDEIINQTRNVRDEIEHWIHDTFGKKVTTREARGCQ